MELLHMVCVHCSVDWNEVVFADAVVGSDYVTRETNADGEVIVKRVVFPEELERGILPKHSI